MKYGMFGGKKPRKSRADSIPSQTAKFFPPTQTNFTLLRFCKPCMACAVPSKLGAVRRGRSRFRKVQRALFWPVHRMGDFKSLESGILHIVPDFPVEPLPGTIIFVTSRKWSDTPNSPVSPDITAQRRSEDACPPAFFTAAAGSFSLKNHANLLYHFCTKRVKIYIELYRFFYNFRIFGTIDISGFITFLLTF